ncbi:hypothetical protein A2230_06625 [candidate division WOR-1 bacterium RIFOXYA2_FULL_36_21]|uniref:Pseudouridine synthase n=1 Tax=candidate division WOR-1 bacterium RIFOXYB2_FULL_36_35 TaxID=1802578 RepID=A0A1F4S0R4_UNCSA|nr:MAG: hypothetical protein A2230_06625 [candidate division WOR-1 bacterium RIFOXYA2_FULL_36_21]OGC14018.1 MAG: hypothetical protein A2290_02380 [candidate division WOR-1 bacterium RIFOXYB2_FULL_36_35]OGC14953.1 MAG: hypothetical protein A2282_06915 [candidate division WOR-1 bacterium RIFOXYA12_FULL_36_13]
MQKPGKIYLVFNKPYGVLCQFTDEMGRRTLKDYIKIPGVYPVGRLDIDSEGLLFLTNDGDVNSLLSNPRNKVYKTYLAQVEGVPTDEMLGTLRKGVVIKGEKTLPAKVKILRNDPKLWEREKPVRFRETIPTSWIEIQICEGKNHQVKRMTSAVGFPCLRLIRTGIGQFFLGTLMPGRYTAIKKPVKILAVGHDLLAHSPNTKNNKKIF